MTTGVRGVSRNDPGQFFDLGGAGYDADASVAGCESRQTGLDGENQE